MFIFSLFLGGVNSKGQVSIAGILGGIAEGYGADIANLAFPNWDNSFELSRVLSGGGHLGISQ